MFFKWLLAVTENLTIGENNVVSYVLVMHNLLEAQYNPSRAFLMPGVFSCYVDGFQPVSCRFGFEVFYLVYFLLGNKKTNEIIMYNFAFIVIHITL